MTFIKKKAGLLYCKAPDCGYSYDVNGLVLRLRHSGETDYSLGSFLCHAAWSLDYRAACVDSRNSGLVWICVTWYGCSGSLIRESSIFAAVMPISSL